jgi:hypothetical protein
MARGDDPDTSFVAGFYFQAGCKERQGGRVADEADNSDFQGIETGPTYVDIWVRSAWWACRLKTRRVIVYIVYIAKAQGIDEGTG